MTTRETIYEAFVAFLIFLAVITIVAAAFLTGQGNGKKEEGLTKICIAEGRSGWNDDEGCFG